MNSRKTAVICSNAVLHAEEGDHATAKQLVAAVHAQQCAALGPDHPHALHRCDDADADADADADDADADIKMIMIMMIVIVMIMMAEFFKTSNRQKGA